MNPNPHRRRMLTAWVAAALLAACATPGPDVRTQVDREADFARYQTFAFVSPLGTDRSGYQTIVSQHLKTAARRELEARGLRHDEQSPQLLVNFHAALAERVRVVPAPRFPYPYYYGYRSGLYAGWPWWVDGTEVRTWREGTINIDVVDAARRQVVWEGVVVGEVTPQAVDDLPGALDRAVTAAFAKFPRPPR
jgi:hypothetical protein